MPKLVPVVEGDGEVEALPVLLRRLLHDEHQRYDEEGNDTADHDLESKDLVDGEWVNIVIEVKATSVRDFRVPMSRRELECAERYGDRYQLHRVIDVASASPQVYVFENLYKLWQEGKARIEPRDTYVTLADPC